MAPSKKSTKKPVSSSDESSSDSSSESSSSSSSSEEQTKKVTKKAAPVATKKNKKVVESSSDDSSSDDSSSDDSSDDSSSDDEPKSKKGSKASNDSDDSSDDDSSDDDSSDSDDSSDDSDDSSEDDSKSKKRVTPASKSSSEESVGTKKQRVAPTLKTTNRVLVDGLANSVTDESLRETFSACGTLDIASVAYDKSGKSRGFGILGFADAASAAKAVQMNGVWKIDDSELIIFHASASSSGPSTPYTPRGSASSYGAGARSPSAPREQGAPSKTLFVKNLAFSLDESALKEAFTEFGTVVGVRMPLNEEGRYKGIGYVEFEDVESATAAIEKCQGQPLNGREIFLDFAQERSQSDRGSFGAPRGRGNGFGGGRGTPRGGRGTPRGGRGGSRGAPAFEGKRMTFDD